MHPLNPRSRWLILPALSIAFGWGLSFALALLSGNESPGRYGLLGGALAGAAALATALSAKPWVGYLAAPPLGVLGFCAVLFGIGVADSYGFLLKEIAGQARGLFAIAMMTAPVVALHGIRMRRPTSWAVVGLGFYLFAGAAAACAILLVAEKWSGADFLFNLCLYAANGAALEVALRMSPKR